MDGWRLRMPRFYAKHKKSEIVKQQRGWGNGCFQKAGCAALIIAGIAVVRSQSIRHNLIKFGAARKENADLMNSLTEKSQR